MPYRKIAFVIWARAIGAVTVLALLPIEHLQLPVFDWWDKAQHVVAFVVLTGGALLLWPGASARVVIGTNWGQIPIVLQPSRLRAACFLGASR